VWSGGQAGEWAREDEPDTERQWFLSASGDELFAFENRFIRYANGDYDVSIYVSTVRLSPHGDRAVYTLTADALEGGEIRLSSDGKANPRALARPRRALADLPSVEVTTLGRPSPSPVAIPHAELVGWLSDTELLVAQGGRLAVYSDGGVRRLEAPHAAARASRAFLR
jgi:hypothetical protein